MAAAEASRAYHNGGLRVIHIAIACMILSGLFFAGRVASRLIKKVPFIASDYVLLVGLVAGWAESGVIIWGTVQIDDALDSWGSEKPLLSGLKNGLKSIFLSSCFGSVSLGCVKLSILLLIRWIFPGRRFHLIIYAVGGFVVAWMIAGILTTIFACNPVHGFWDYDMLPAPTCINLQRFFIGLAIPNTAADIAILCLPMKKVWDLQMERKFKVPLTFVFLFGTFTVIMSIVRFTTLFRLNRHNLGTLGDLSIWTVSELTAAIACASLPTMRPLLQRLTPRSHWYMKKSNPNAQNDGHTTHTNVASMRDTLTLLSSTRKELGDKFLRLEDGSEGAMPWTSTFPSPTHADSNDDQRCDR